MNRRHHDTAAELRQRIIARTAAQKAMRLAMRANAGEDVSAELNEPEHPTPANRAARRAASKPTGAAKRRMVRPKGKS